ncbi:hypothetical protein [Klebsiella oxytoca]|uniref:hypothetical protein n=1 Tax=Klebsiella oxytoca TaxID=571 RepID=UPI001897C047|nr:hypothetical protein [Klebsiella oxytoca]
MVASGDYCTGEKKLKKKNKNPITHFERLDDLLTELAKYDHTEFWYKETNIGVPGTSGARCLRRIFTRDNREIARWGFNGRRWDFLPAYLVPNEDVNCKSPSDAELIVPALMAEIQWNADMSDNYKS